MNRLTRSIASGLLMLLTVLLTGLFTGPAYAADDASIDHAETSDGQVKLLVSVPGTDTVDLSSVKVKIGSAETTATATSAGSASDVKRVTMLAIDTSQSMAGARIAAARLAAKSFLATVPDNVEVGIVTFDNSVVVRQKPSLDRTVSGQVIDKLTLARSTALYDGVLGAIKAMPTSGQRDILVLSDGKDTTRTPVSSVVSAITRSKVQVDVVALQQSGDDTAPLTELAQAGNGAVLNAADAKALTDAFAGEADQLARQVLVTADVPAGQKKTDASVTVSLAAGATTYSDSAFVSVRGKSDKANQTPVPIASSRFEIPRPVMLGAVAAIGIGLIGLIFALASTGESKSKPASITDQIQAYGVHGITPRTRKDEPHSPIDQARQAAESVLASNKSLEARIATRLEGAGLALKPSEWVLIHVGIAIALALIGLLLGAGKPVLAVIFLLLGAVGPWIYLGLKRSRRLKAFDSGLADTLQLMSGSLSAGLSLAQSIDTIVREGSEPITSEFKRVIVESRLGVTIEDAMEGVGQRMQSKDFEWVVMAIRIQREVGGNLAELLLTVAATLREREYLRRHVSALSAEGRLSCWILGGLPPLFLAYLTLTKPDYVHPLYSTPIGWLMCGAMAVLLSVGMFWMSKVAKVEL